MMSCPVVSTRNGQVRGKVVHLKCKDAKPVYVYRNIPFASPPKGSLRFMPPKPADSWTGVRDGTKPGNMPMQSGGFLEMSEKVTPMIKPSENWPPFDEDCLHLTVYTTEMGKGKRLPVMVWFYGGGVQVGQEIAYDGSPLAGMNDVIVVMPNYRVGIFGFLSLGQASACSGNAGVMDQRMALMWVRDNIEAFGGDNSNVTIFGESAGATCVSFHVLSPISRGLFHKAISQSGQSTIPGNVMTEEKRASSVEALLKHFKIDEKDDVKILEALQKVPSDEMQKAYEAILMEKAYFATVVDGKMIPEEPNELLARGEFSKVPYMMGCNNTEGFGLLAMGAGAQFETGIGEDVARRSMIQTMSDEEFEACKRFYIRDQNDAKKFSKLLAYITGDGMFVAPLIKSANAHQAAGCSTYVFMGSFPLRMHQDVEYGPDIIKKGDWCVCDHGNDIYMVLGTPFASGELTGGAKFSTEEELLSRKVMAYFSNFAKNGDPNKGVEVPLEWPKYKSGGDHMIFAHPVKIGNTFSADVIKFWNETLPKLSKS